MSKFANYILFVFTFFISTLLGVVHEIENLHDINLHQINSNTYVLFDIDNTVVAPCPAWLWEDDFLSDKMGWSENHYNSQEVAIFLNKLRSGHVHYQFVDKDFPHILQKIHDHGAKIGCLTARSDIDQDLMHFFQRMKIHFDLPIENQRHGKVQSHHSIICTHHQHKGSSLFKIIPELSQKVVFIDDLVENCWDVFNSCQERGIECLAYHYKGADRLFNADLAHFQYDHWHETGVILSDSDALEQFQQIRND